jgi:membrane-bound lytic murein transglycosylase D
MRAIAFVVVLAAACAAAEKPHWQRLVEEVLERSQKADPEEREPAVFERCEDAPDLHPRAARFAGYFMGRGAAGFAAASQRLAPWRGVVERIFQEEGVPVELIWLGYVESGWDARARSPKDALGMWQLMAPTARRFGLAMRGVDERTDVALSTRAAARYLRWLYARFGDWNLTLAAYNAGEGRVEQAMRRSGTRDFWELSAWLPEETANYVPAVLGAMAAGGAAGLPLEKETAKAHGARIVRAGITLAP